MLYDIWGSLYFFLCFLDGWFIKFWGYLVLLGIGNLVFVIISGIKVYGWFFFGLWFYNGIKNVVYIEIDS